MAKKLVWAGGASLLALGVAACVSATNETAESEAKPFIEPLVLSQSMCSGKSVQALGSGVSASNSSGFEFSEPFKLPDAVVAHFHYPVSTGSEEAQYWFDTGLAHMANFNHDEAIAAFRAAQEHDPECAMCYWGEGLSFGSNINMPYDANRGAAGRAAADKAMTAASGLYARERALIKALEARYNTATDGTVEENAAAFADAMDKTAQQFSSDKLILSLAAEANMDTQPWDYWEAGARIPKGRTARTLELLEMALEKDPEFAPAIHLYIHITESSVDPFRAEAYADKLWEESLGIGHLVHMPSHIYLRLGRWKKSLAANLDAIAADEHYIANSANADVYGSVYYPHNVHFVVASAQFAGDAETSHEMANKLTALTQLAPGAADPLNEHIAASKIFTDLLFSSDETVLASPAPEEAHLYMQTAWRYARGSVLARQGKIAGAKEALAQLRQISSATGFSDYENLFGAPLPGVLKVAELTLEGRILAAEGDLAAAIENLEAAAEVEAQIPYFEPTWWYYPTRQTLAALLLKDNQLDRAEREFYKTLIKSPNNAYALFGLAETFKAKGDDRSEAYARELFNEAWLGETGEIPSIDQL